MIAVACSCIMVLSLLLASGQAFLTASVPGYEHSLMGRASTLSPSTPTAADKSEAGPGGRPSAQLVPLDDDSRGSSARDSEDDEEDEDEPEDDDSLEDYAMPAAVPVPKRHDEQTVYVIEFETEAEAKGDGHRNRAGKGLADEMSEGQSPLDPWSIVWYIGSFGGLVAFFLIVSCSEWCCRRGARPLSVPYTQRGEVINAAPQTESPPPPYHLFAPPPYDSVNYADLAGDKLSGVGGGAEKLDIYVITVPIHGVGPLGQQQQQPPA